MTSKKIETLAVAYAAAKRGLEKIKEQEKTQSKATQEIEAALFDALEDEGLTSVGIEDVGKFRLNDLAWAKIEDRALALAWADENRPEMLTLNHQQLSVVVRNALKGDGEIPPGVTFTASRKIGWTKA
jgi:hypothetical protein